MHVPFQVLFEHYLHLFVWIVQKIAVRENPCMEPFQYKRLELLSYIPALRETNCGLHIVDTRVGMEERVAAWQLGGGEEADVEAFRADCAIMVRAPPQQDASTVESLDLENTNLHHIDLSHYTALKHLRYIISSVRLRLIVHFHAF